MNKIIHGVLLSALTISAAQAQLHSNRTYLRARDSLSHNGAMNMMGQARRLHGAKGGFGSTVSVTGYYREMHNKSDVAKYFGGGQAVNSDQLGTIVAGAEPTTHEGRANNLSGDNIQHLDAGTGSATGTITLAPTRTEYGAHINWSHDLSKWMKGLYISADLPIARVETNMGVTSTDATVTSYFAGTLTGTGADAQTALSHARIDATKRTKTDLADLGLTLNYRVRDYKDSKLHFSGHFTVPTSKKHDGVNLLQPQAGSGGHFGFGGSVHWLTRLWHTNPCTQGLDLFADANYRYLFSTNQTRTLGLYNHWYNRLATAGHYRNLGKAGATSATPGANALTRTVNVTPGSEFSGIVGLKYHYKNLNLFASYNLYARDKEAVKLSATNKWFDAEYAMMATGHAMTTAVVAGKNAHTIGGLIQQEGNTVGATDSAGVAVGSNNAAQYYISTAACASPSHVTHSVGGAAEMQFPKFKVPFSLSAGGNYEFAEKTHNRGMESWTAWGKLSVCF